MQFRSSFRAGVAAGLLTATLVASNVVSFAQNRSLVSGKPLVYPVAKKVDHVDDYHGTKVADPYRWLEDSDSADTKSWIEAENSLTFNYLNQIPEREQIKKRLTELWNYEKFGAPSKQGNRYVFSKNDGLQNQSVLYTVDSLDGTPRVLLDPNTLSKDGTVALSGTSFTDDGKLMAYAIASAGSDWTEWHVRNVETGEDLPDVVKWVKFSGASWMNDNSGFFYNRYETPTEANKLQMVNQAPKLCYHKLGTPQSEDQVVYERPDNPKLLFNGGVTDDGKYLVVSLRSPGKRGNSIVYKDLTAKDAKFVTLIDNYEASYSPVENEGTTVFMWTDRDAPRGKVVAIDLNAPEAKNWKEIIPQSAETLQGASLFGNTFYATYLKDARTQIKTFDLTGKPTGEVKLPGIGSAGGFGGKRTATETFYTFTSYTAPPRIFRYDLKTGRSTLFREAKVAFDPNQYETKQVFYASKDGTKVPMFITHKKGLKLDGQNPTLLYGYGGFNISQTPGFSVARVVWMEMGGIFAVANLRGGGEYGEDWHMAGTKLKKQNVFDDFIGAAEWLIANKYTSSPKLAIQGGSNGGLLVGACMTQRPDLFGACLPAVGVMDMLRFHKFTIGYAWITDYGSSDNPEEFKALYAYSPLHNIKPGTKYPATLVTTADHDDRVVPAHSFKFAATLQAAQAGDAPVLIRIETKAGHGGGKPTAKIIEETSDIYGFLVKSLNIKLK